jgi:hypothetical protein
MGILISLLLFYPIFRISLEDGSCTGVLRIIFNRFDRSLRESSTL